MKQQVSRFNTSTRWQVPLTRCKHSPLPMEYENVIFWDYLRADQRNRFNFIWINIQPRKRSEDKGGVRRSKSVFVMIRYPLRKEKEIFIFTCWAELIKVQGDRKIKFSRVLSNRKRLNWGILWWASYVNGWINVESVTFVEFKRDGKRWREQAGPGKNVQLLPLHHFSIKKLKYTRHLNAYLVVALTSNTCCS